MSKVIKVIIIGLTLISLSFGAEILVDNLPDFEDAINNSQAGDEIILKDGKYTSSEYIKIRDLSGNEENPIVIRSESVGGVEITGEGNFEIKYSDHLIIDGFFLTQKAESKSFKIYDSQYLRVTNCTFDLVEEGKKNYWLYISGSGPTNNIRIDHS